MVSAWERVVLRSPPTRHMLPLWRNGCYSAKGHSRAKLPCNPETEMTEDRDMLDDCEVAAALAGTEGEP
jgi:hypothetical protein